MTPSFSQHIWIGFAGGLAGFAHCIGMCGPFVLQFSRSADRSRRPWLAPALWLAGKWFSYLFLGAIAGFTGDLLLDQVPGLIAAQRQMGWLAGIAILLAGLSTLGLLPAHGARAHGAVSEALSAATAKLLLSPAPGTALVVGMVSGLLPCPIVLAFLVYALEAGSVATGMATMGALGLGTVIPLLLVGCLPLIARFRCRPWAPKVGGALLLFLGLVTILRGTSLLHHLLGCGEPPTISQTAAVPDPECCIRGTHGKGSGN